MKKLTVLVCTMAIGLSLTGCGGNDNNASTQPSTTIPATTESSQESTTAPSQESTPETAPAGDQSAAVSEEMQAIKKAVTDALGENYWPNSQIPVEMAEGTFGLTSDMYDEFFGEMPMISTNVDTLIVVKAKEGKAEAVAEALNKYRDSLVNDTMQYPMNLGKIQASQVEVIGNYVCFLQLGADTQAASDKGEEAVIEHCKEQNGLALDAIRSVVEK